MALNPDLNTGLSNFAYDLYQKCADESIDKNIILSPFSVVIALALLSQIAQNNTLTQILRGLHLGNDKSLIAARLSEQNNLLSERAGETILSIVNQLYIKNGLQTKKSFRDIAINQFKSGVESLDFSNSQAAALKINSFVESKTNSKIKNLFAPRELTADTSMIIVNVIYFKGLWDIDFPVHRTLPGDFFTDQTNKIQVDFMTESDGFRYAELNDLNSKVVELKYKRSNMSLVVVLPNSRTGLSALESSLHNYDFKRITTQIRDEYVQVTLPKFKFEYEIDLSNVLQKMEMTDMFSEHADLSGLSESGQPLKVSKVIHKAFIEINEKGIEAAAATGISVVPLSLNIWKKEKKIFRADHPFLFFIMDVEKNIALFSGRFKK